MNDAMYKLTADANYRFMGGDSNPKTAGTQTYSKIFKKNFEKAIKQQSPSDEDHGSLEIELFLSKNFDHSKENVKKLKRMSKDISFRNKIDDEDTEGNQQRVKYNPKEFIN